MNKELQQYYLQQMGIELWQERSEEMAKAPDSDDLNVLCQEVASCQQCALHKTRRQTVFARGNSKARLMVIGEAPGYHEDQQGKPFVGRAGGLLDQMLKSIGFSEDDVYIANVLKCRPPDNRDPNGDEIVRCSQYLTRQIAIIKPVALLAVGRFAGQFLLKEALSMAQMRSSVHHYEGTPCIVSYHPAYLLRKPMDKKKAYKDLLQLKTLLN
ncbi:uracil-DNA glycosylase family protein [Legionella sp. 16cNR16C]|uniref:uracil-DNA glycosylase n=1 Tax=Legionella sp. 16cNR16C TaxID=2905656 RepID=UPI001E53663E|nr:uracil-DNA glycosylase [Legionella sp. 16cNR16C]MCE3043912.1 uracil-DNA glycosylase [Legionella sp. 16cNR16C]